MDEKTLFNEHLNLYRAQCRSLDQESQSLGSVANISSLQPILTDFLPGAEAGDYRGHYFHQDLLVANYIFHARPSLHLDIGSRVDGFISHLLAFDQRIILADIRPLNYFHQSLQFFRLDISADIPPFLARAFSSISSLHAIEHVGLGRYGDQIDPMGHVKSISNLSRLLAPFGTLYLSFPTGYSRVEFNSQRVISIDESLSIFQACGLTPRYMRLIDDNGDLLPVTFTAHNDWGRSLRLYAGCAVWTLQNELSATKT